MARLPRVGKVASATPFAPPLRWLAFDGSGCDQAFSDPQGFVDRQEASRFRCFYAARVADERIGRALWGLDSADPDRVATMAASLPAARRPDLWCGIGLAATYSGGTSQAGLEALRDAPESYLLHVAQGAAFAAKAGLHADGLTSHTDRSAPTVAAITDKALRELPATAAEVAVPSSQAWCRRIRLRFIRSQLLAKRACGRGYTILL